MHACSCLALFGEAAHVASITSLREFIRARGFVFLSERSILYSSNDSFLDTDIVWPVAQYRRRYLVSIVSISSSCRVCACVS